MLWIVNDINQYYRVLELEPGASPQEIKQAYKELAQIWHPDRSSHNPQLQQKTPEKLKAINEAYEGLRDFHRVSTSSPPAQAEQAQPSPKPDQSQSPPQRSESEKSSPGSNSKENQHNNFFTRPISLSPAGIGFLSLMNVMGGTFLGHPAVPVIFKIAVWPLHLALSWPQPRSLQKLTNQALRIWAIIIWVALLWMGTKLDLDEFHSRVFGVNGMAAAIAPFVTVTVAQGTDWPSSLKCKVFLIVAGSSWLSLALGFVIGSSLFQFKP